MCIIQKGKAIIVMENEGDYLLSVLHPGDHIIMKKEISHNMYLFKNTITHTVKYGDIEKNDWVFHNALNEYCKTIDVSMII